MIFPPMWSPTELYLFFKRPSVDTELDMLGPNIVPFWEMWWSLGYEIHVV
jgi:hypothetical protein